MRGILEIPLNCVHVTHLLRCSHNTVFVIFESLQHDIFTIFKAILPVKRCFLQHWCRQCGESLNSTNDGGGLEDAEAPWSSSRSSSCLILWTGLQACRWAESVEMKRWETLRGCECWCHPPPRAQISRAPLAHHSIGWCLKLSANGLDSAACCKKG